ncbi:MAG TPA: PQQ-dependent sugar dehydrogenase, partial [Phnomibacter sp.]|nr:PQQ-dependent sugar dehydrogenase [Phnomibacter sp.]
TPGDPSSNNSTWPSIAPSGMDYYGSSAIPGWQNSLLVANLKAGYVSRFKLNSDGTKIISNNIRYFSGQNRYRDIIVSADGTKFYVACDNTTTTSGPGGGAVTSPGAILEFSYQVPAPAPPAMPLQQTEQVVEASKQVSVYPNPANSEVRIYAAPSLQVASITLMNQAAQPVANKAFAGGTTTLQTQNLPAGVYWIQMFNKQGKRVHLQKLIIQH